MRSPEARRPGMCLARCMRWLGFDRNPLRRRTDRIEAAPIAAIVVGRQADHLALRQANAQQVADHEVTAVLLRQAQATGVPDPYTSVELTYVLARWQPPGQAPRSGQVLASAGAHAGSTVKVWIDASGAVTSPPPDHRIIAGDVCLAAIVTCLVASLVILGSNALARRALDRRRMRAWDAEWRAAGPMWSGHRG
jgi:hypothetical protein